METIFYLLAGLTLAIILDQSDDEGLGLPLYLLVIISWPLTLIALLWLWLRR